MDKYVDEHHSTGLEPPSTSLKENRIVLHVLKHPQEGNRGMLISYIKGAARSSQLKDIVASVKDLHHRLASMETIRSYFPGSGASNSTMSAVMIWRLVIPRSFARAMIYSFCVREFDTPVTAARSQGSRIHFFILFTPLFQNAAEGLLLFLKKSISAFKE